ncbi:MAG: multicopper oxidase family protein [Gemmatimonadaceae bacterium]
MNRRIFLANSILTAAAAATNPLRWEWWQTPADHTIRIAPMSLELAPGCVVRTTAYNGSVPGHLLRLREGRPVTVDVTNATDHDEWVHWHGLTIPSDVDGSGEEGTPAVKAHGARRYTFTPQPAGFRWYHSHRFAGHDLRAATYSGQFGFLMIDGASEPGSYDGEHFLALHDWGPYETGGDDGYRFVRYNHASINGRLLGAGDPIRVRAGERVLFHILNASATDPHWIALPGHRFIVTALDGNPVPTAAAVDTLRLGPGERIDAVVTMNEPGAWILGECQDHIRNAGMGVVVEYAGRSGPPRWITPAALAWDYGWVEAHGPATAGTGGPAEPIPMVIQSTFHGHVDFEHWAINGDEFPHGRPIPLREGTRYRLTFDNRSNDDHPLHLHRHRFELRRFGARSTAGVIKDVVIVPAFTSVDVEFNADNPGSTLFHCHNQSHMDFGFMKLLSYV